MLDHLRNVTAMLDRRGPDIDRALANFATATTTLNGDLGDLHKTLTDADAATLKFERVAGDLDSQVNGAELAQFVSQSRALVQSLTALSDKIDREPSRIIFGDRRKGYTPP